MTLTLTLLRHAKSGWDAPVTRDFDRPLNVRGTRCAHAVGAELARRGMAFDLVISSPAVRCTDTLDGIWESYGQILHPVWDRRIYLASSVSLLEVVHGLPDTASHVLMCGHNPGLEDLILDLVPDDGNAERDAVEEKFPTAAVAELALTATRWADVKRGQAKIQSLFRPRDLDPALTVDDD